MILGTIQEYNAKNALVGFASKGMIMLKEKLQKKTAAYRDKIVQKKEQEERRIRNEKIQKKRQKTISLNKDIEKIVEQLPIILEKYSTDKNSISINRKNQCGLHEITKNYFMEVIRERFEKIEEWCESEDMRCSYYEETEIGVDQGHFENYIAFGPSLCISWS